jgi:voltage-gated potassium channel
LCINELKGAVMGVKGLKKENLKKRIFQIVEVGYTQDRMSRLYDIVNVAAIIINLVVSILYTFDPMEEKYGGAIITIEGITVLFFAFDYILRIYTARYLDEDVPEWKAVLQYIFSFTGIVDLLSFLPYYLPFFLPGGAIAFRMFRVVRIFRLFRINAYYDSLNVITEVIVSKKQQLLSSVFIVLVLMVASSLCMYSLEHEAQPEVFSNAFSGIWWAASTLLTVGYGDIYPVTAGGQFLGMVIAFLGVGVVAIPTGIISAGFVEQYQKLSASGRILEEQELQFIRVPVKAKDAWAGLTVSELPLPKGAVCGLIQRDNEILMPERELELEPGDKVLIFAESIRDAYSHALKKITLTETNPWCGTRIRDLDISRLTYIVAVRRNGHTIIPKEDLTIKAGDTVFLYSRTHLPEAEEITI